jgi:hypothetical protein
MDDSECFESSPTSFVSSYVTASSSHHGGSYSTYSAALTDTLSDFHEAKVAHPRHGGQRSDRQPSLSPTDDNIGSIQDKYNEGQELDSGSDILSDSLEETDSVGLSRVEAGVLSACGVLVVAGIAVGIFVWRNTIRRRDLRGQGNATDLESHLDSDPHDKGSNSLITNSVLSMEDINGQQKKQRRLGKQKQDASLNKSVVTMKPNQEEQHQMIEIQDPSKPTVIGDMVLPALEQSNDNMFASDELQQTIANITIELEQTPSQSNISDHKEKLASDAILDTFQLSEQSLNIGENNVTRLHPVDTVNLRPNSTNDDMSSIYKTPDTMELDKDSIPAAQLDSSTYKPNLSGSPGIEENTTAHTSALDPTFDPTALTYPLKKLLHTPRTIASPAQISVDLGRYEEDHDEDEGEKINIQQPKEAPGESKHDRLAPKIPTLKLGQQLNKLFRYPDQSTLKEQEQDSNKAPKIMDISLVSPFAPPNNKTKPKKNRMLKKFIKAPLKVRRPSSAQSIKEDYTEKYETEHGKPFLSPLDLPNDKYIPLHDAAGPPLMSRAQVLADPVRRLGEDEIALWEQNRQKKELKNLSYEMRDEQIIREEVEDYDRKYIACYYGEPSSTAKEGDACR